MIARVMSSGGLSAKRFQSACALPIYLIISVLFFGLPLLGHFGHRFIGYGADPLVQMWALAWWPHALAFGVHPIITQAVWPPIGYNLAWSPASLPGPSLALYPITRVFGPIVSYNILCLLCPALAAFSTFVLRRYMTGEFWPAMVGGYTYGFSQYVQAHMLAHVNLLLIFPIPLAIYFVLLRLGQRISRAVFLILFGMYFFLVAAVIASFYLSQSSIVRWSKLLPAALHF